jgi:hypothetical protein
MTLGTGGYIGGIRWTDLYFRYWQLVIGSFLSVFGTTVYAVWAFFGKPFPPPPPREPDPGTAPYLLSAVTVLVGCLLLLRYAYGAFRNRRLRRAGGHITAKITKVMEDRSFSINNVHPMRIVAGAEVNGERREFRSQGFAFDPSEYLKAQEIEALAVYVDSRKPDVYFMDTSFLTQRDLVPLLTVLFFWNVFTVITVVLIAHL